MLDAYAKAKRTHATRGLLFLSMQQTRTLNLGIAYARVGYDLWSNGSQLRAYLDVLQYWLWVRLLLCAPPGPASLSSHRRIMPRVL
jgi:hypothetical protein